MIQVKIRTLIILLLSNILSVLTSITLGILLIQTTERLRDAQQSHLNTLEKERQYLDRLSNTLKGK